MKESCPGPPSTDSPWSGDKSLTYGCLQTLPLISSLGHRFLRFTVPDQHIFAQEVPPGLVETSRSPEFEPHPTPKVLLLPLLSLVSDLDHRCQALPAYAAPASFSLSQALPPIILLYFYFRLAICFPETLPTPDTGSLGDGTYLEPSFAVCC